MKYLSLPQLATLRFASAGQFVAIGGPVHPRRTLDTHVLLIGCGGTYPIAVDGTEFLLTENTFLLLPAGVEHTGTSPATAGQSHLWCHFALPCASLLSSPGKAEGGVVLPLFGTVAHMEKYTVLFHQLINAEYRQYTDPTHRLLLTGGYLTLLLTELAEECSVGNGSDAHLVLVRKVEEYIRLHACEGIRPADVAAHFHYNCDYLTSLLRASLGRSLVECITGCRLDVAKKLLLDTELSIHEIARQAGFEDSKYFMKLFRRAEKMTPSEYRQTWSYLHMNRQ